MADKIPLKLTTGPNEIQEFAAGGTPDTVPIVNLPTSVVYETTPQTLTNKILADTTSVSTLKSGGVSGVDSLIVANAGGSGSSSDRVVLIAGAVGSGAIVRAGSFDPNADLKLQSKGTGNVYVQSNGIAVGETGSQTLTNKTLVAPTIGASEFTNANHTHQSGATGGQLTTAAISSGVFNQTFVADAAYRTGSYANGRGSSVLIDNVTGSGQAQWANRPRVLQVQTGSYTITPSPTAFTTFSVYTGVLNATGGVTMNTTPDCLVDTTGSSTPTLSGNTLAGKLFKVTYAGKFTTTLGTSKSILVQLEFENGGNIAKATVAGATNAVPVSNGRFWGSGYVLFTAAQGNAGTVRVWQEMPLFFGTGVAFPYGGYSSTDSIPETSMTIANGSTIYIRVKGAVSSSPGIDSFTVDSVIYEALN
jgi:hypothetical protein